MSDLAGLYLVGIGFGALGQMTMETRDILSCCRVVLHYGDHPRELRKLNPNLVDLSKMYWTGEDCQVVYERLVKRVLEEVAEGPGVASVTYGHPLFFDDVHAQLLKRSKRAGFECVVLPAISCFDTLCIDLQIDYGDPGVSIFEATDLVFNRRRMNPELHTLVLQIGEFAVDETADTIEPRKGMYNDLVAYLTKFFPADHRATVCFSDDGEGNVLINTRVGKIDSHWRRIFPGTSLYVPPVPVM